MYLTVGEIAKVLGMSTEMIRFYVREGIITPKQNPENSYWEYSSEDVLLLSDILFYRDLDLPLSDIKSILAGTPVDEIGSIIRERKKAAIESIHKYTSILSKLESWEDYYNEEMFLLTHFEVGVMPPELRKAGYFDEECDHIARYIKNSININKEDWINVSYSFYCNIFDEEIKLKKYLSVNKTESSMKINQSDDIIEESAERCIITQVHYSDEPMEMLAPLMQYAQENGYELAGDIYGRENTNYFVDGKRTGIYRIYALLK